MVNKDTRLIIRTLAEAATKGAWFLERGSNRVLTRQENKLSGVPTITPVCWVLSRDDGDYITIMQPAVVISLIDLLEKTIGERDRAIKALAEKKVAIPTWMTQKKRRDDRV